MVGKRRRRTQRDLLMAAAALLVVVTSGCKMDVDVGIEVDRDGSGEVAVAVDLDAEVADRLPDLSAQLRLDDLESARWEVEGPTTTAGGSTVITATRSFATPEEATLVLQDLSGAQGPFQGLEVARRSSFLATDYTFTGAVDLSAGVEAFADEELRSRLEGSGFSLETSVLEQAIGAQIDETFSFEVRVTLPGSLTVEGVGVEEGDSVVWNPVVGERLTLAATSETLHRQRLAWLAASGGAFLAMVVVVVLGRRRRR
jgi:hypothetical protein